MNNHDLLFVAIIWSVSVMLIKGRFDGIENL